MVSAARTQVSEAEKHLAETLQRAERLLTDTDAVVRRRQDDARRNAEAIVAAAEAEAEQLRESARQEVLNERAVAQRTVERLERQRESIAGYLDEMRGLLGTRAARSITGLDPVDEPSALASESEAVESSSSQPDLLTYSSEDEARN